MLDKSNVLLSHPTFLSTVSTFMLYFKIKLVPTPLTLISLENLKKMHVILNECQIEQALYEKKLCGGLANFLDQLASTCPALQCTYISLPICFLKYIMYTVMIFFNLTPPPPTPLSVQPTQLHLLLQAMPISKSNKSKKVLHPFLLTNFY